MDITDRRILMELQRNGRLTVSELADRVNLTSAPCSRRLRDLERNSVITGYRALVDRFSAGLTFEGIVHIVMNKEDAATVTAFETALQGVDEVLQAERLFGDPDYLLRVVAHDIDDYARIRDQKIATLPGVERITSTIVMSEVIPPRPLPLLDKHGRIPKRHR